MTDPATLNRTSFLVEGLHCTCCAEQVEGAVRSLPGVERVRLDLTSGRLTVDHDAAVTDEERIRAAVRAHGYRPEGEPAR